MRLNFSIIIFFFAVVFGIIFFDAPLDLTLPLTTFLLIVSIILQTLKNNKIHIPKKFSIFFALYFFSQVLSLFKIGVLLTNTLGIIKLSDFYLIVLYLYNVKNINLNKFFYIFSIIAGILSLWGITDYSGRIHSDFPKFLFEPFHWPIFSATFFLLAGPVTFSLFLNNKKNNIKNAALFISLIFIIIANYLSKSYFIFLLISFLFITAVYVKQNLEKEILREKLFQIIISILILLALLPNIGSSFGSNSINSASAKFQEKVIFLNKEEITKFAKEVLKNSPFFGVGLGNFENEFYFWQKKPWSFSSYANSEIVQTLIETGVVGATGEIILFSYILYISVKVIFKKNKILLPIAFSVSCFSILCCVNFSFRIFPIAIIFFVLFSTLIINKGKFFVIRMNKLAFVVVPFILLSLLLTFDSIILRKSQRLIIGGYYQTADYWLDWLEKRPKFILNPRTLITKASLLLGQKNYRESIKYLAKAKSINKVASDEIDYQIASIESQNKLLNDPNLIIENKIKEGRYIPLKYYYTYAKSMAINQNSEAAANYLKDIIPEISPKDKFIDNPYNLEVMSQTDDLLSLKELLKLTYQLTKDSKYLVEFNRFTIIDKQ